MKKRPLLLAWSAWTVLATSPAWAYLDPASGSMILQLILGGLAGAAVAIKLFWRRLLALFGGRNRDRDESAP